MPRDERLVERQIRAPGKDRADQEKVALEGSAGGDALGFPQIADADDQQAGDAQNDPGRAIPAEFFLAQQAGQGQDDERTSGVDHSHVGRRRELGPVQKKRLIDRHATGGGEHQATEISSKHACEGLPIPDPRQQAQTRRAVAEDG